MNNREFKFRCWELENKCWANMAYLECCENELKHILFHDKPEKYVIQQFTGLKDKNGREIYEGDIVKTVNTSEEKIYNVYFYHGSFYINGDSISCYIIIEKTMQIPYLEITGNIFENPELLKND